MQGKRAGKTFTQKVLVNSYFRNIELLSLSYGKHTRLSSQNGKTETTITACIVLTLFLCFGQILALFL